MNRYRKFEVPEEGLKYLSQIDDKLSKIIQEFGNINREIIPDSFIALVNSIIFQQLAFKAAVCIWERFEKLVKEITPENILNISDKELRTCGLSKTKIKYIKNISNAVILEEIDLNNLEEKTNNEIIDMLVKVKGIGEWTAEMFLIFSLGREDILSYKDLGIRRGIQYLCNMENEPNIDEFNKVKEKWSPYNTIASFYLWELTLRGYLKKNKDKKEKKVTKNKKVIVNNDVHNFKDYYSSTIGLIEIQANNDKIISLDFVENKVIDYKTNEITEMAVTQLEEYFCGERKEFNLPLDYNGTDFQVNVWKELIKISYGETASYGEIAKRIGNEKASRAIGNANNKNKIAILIPCHRVIGANGKLVGYEGGVWRKKWLLEHEKK